MVTARRTTLVVLLVGAAFLIAMLMSGAGQRGAPDVAKAATAQGNSHSSTARHTAKAVKAKARAHKAHASRRGMAKMQRIAATTDAPGAEAPGSETESSTEPAGEPADGYEDPAGQDVQHECPPACGPGEQG